MDRMTAWLRAKRWRRVLGWGLIAIAVFEGIALGLYLLDRRPEMSEALPAPVVASTTTSAGAPTTTSPPPIPDQSMPLVIGLDADRAREILLDAGLAEAAITVGAAEEHPGPIP